MTSVTTAKCLESKTSLSEALRRFSLFDEGPLAPNSAVQQTVIISLKETLAGFQSEDLKTAATMLRNIIGQIDMLLLERQLAECGFDAVRASVNEAKTDIVLEPAAIPKWGDTTAV